MQEAGGKYPHSLIVSAHINDTLMACESIDTLNDFKREFLTRFEGTDEGPTNPSTSGRWCTRAKSYNSMGRGTNWPSKHPRKREYVYLQPTRQKSLTLNYTDDTVCPGPVHLKAAEQVLQFLRSSYEDGLTYSNPGLALWNRLLCWVDSDYASDPDTRKSVTGYVLSLNNVPISWKAKRQDCVTLSSAEAEYVAASMVGQEVVYLRVILRGFGHEQLNPTEVWEDNAACIQIANHPVNRKFTRHIDTPGPCQGRGHDAGQVRRDTE
eukprot:126265-Rhodomonas_salina.1